jgi:biotin carboxyl carrier protein
MGRALGEIKPMKYVAIINDEQYEVEIQKDGSILLNGEPREVDFLPLGESLYSVITEHSSLEVVIDESDGLYSVMLGGRLYEGQVLDERALMMAQRRGGLTVGSGEVHSPMPGLIVKIPVEEGQAVSHGDTVIILESMKMQNEIKSPLDGVVTKVLAQSGQTVDKNALLIVIEPLED